MLALFALPRTAQHSAAQHSAGSRAIAALKLFTVNSFPHLSLRFALKLFCFQSDVPSALGRTADSPLEKDMQLPLAAAL